MARAALTVIMGLFAMTAAWGSEPDRAHMRERLTPEVAERFAGLALACVHREYPNIILHVLNDDTDARPPRDLHPVFYGCFDWHSSVHGHWLLVRLLHLMPDAPFADDARAALTQSFSQEAIAGEVAYFEAEGRAGFERPYGLAWFLQLTAELHQWADRSGDPDAARWLAMLKPLEAVIARNISDWVPKLVYPVRSGTHNQTAFAFALIHDWAQVMQDRSMASLIAEASRAFHLGDTGCPLAYEPSGDDFLSPCLMEADLMRRFLKPGDFAAWLTAFLPQIPEDGSDDWLAVAEVSDRSDGKLVHLDGVNLSRAWNLEMIAAHLPADDPRIPALLAAADIHAASGIASVSAEHYAGSHWLASFATYLVTRRGLDATP